MIFNNDQTAAVIFYFRVTASLKFESLWVFKLDRSVQYITEDVYFILLVSMSSIEWFSSILLLSL